MTVQVHTDMPAGTGEQDLAAEGHQPIQSDRYHCAPGQVVLNFLLNKTCTIVLNINYQI